jgi:site-specific DNA-cytosine methylase
MFDGIGTGLYVLQRLNISVSVYFSCEVDEKALSVARRNFHGQMVMLGCVKSLTTQVLECLGRIDLLIGIMDVALVLYVWSY